MTNPPTVPPMHDLLQKPSPIGTQATTAKIAAYTTAKAVWSKKNAQGLGLIQATVSNMIWQKHQSLGTAKEVLDALETKFGAEGGAQTYLQLVNMVKLQFTDLMDLLPQIQGFQDNYNLIMLNGHSRLSKDLATFMFCLSLLNRLPGNTLITSRLLPIIKFRISLHKFCKKRTGKRPWLSDKACPSISSPQQRTWGKSVLNVEKQTTQQKITGLGGRTRIKKAKDNSSPKNCQIRPE